MKYESPNITENSADTWHYGQVISNALNVRRSPSRSAPRWNNVLPMCRLILVRACHAAGWYETMYRGEAAYVMSDYINILDKPVSDVLPERMLFMVQPEQGRSKSIYFNGYGGAWCHRFADWLAMNAGMPKEFIPNTSNCRKGVTWFATSPQSGGFFFKSNEHKQRFIRNVPTLSELSPVLTDEEVRFVPSPGDYVYFRWNTAATHISVSHVGIVEKADGDGLTTWEGNAGKKVKKKSYPLNDPQIVGYGQPMYSAWKSISSQLSA